ncbi:hypothetical protein GC169_07840 [bacterium]|nr:hypothetical protein [bacterium]
MGDDLSKRIGDAVAKQRARSAPREGSTARGASVGLRMASDFAAAIIVGAGLGWGIDALFNVSPWGLISGLLLGFGTGVRNVVATASAYSAGGTDEATSAEAREGRPGPAEGSEGDGE